MKTSICNYRLKLIVISATAAMLANLLPAENIVENEVSSSTDTNNTVDVSHGLGIPFGGLGTGYSVFGKYGFVWLNFNGRPNPETYISSLKDSPYLGETAQKAPFCFVLEEDSNSTLLQTTSVSWLPKTQPMGKVSACAYLPKGLFTFTKPSLDLNVTMTGFSPMIPYDLVGSSIPVQVFDITIENPTAKKRLITLRLAHEKPLETAADGIALLKEPAGQMAFAAMLGTVDGHGVAVKLQIEPGQRQQARFFVSWYYPDFKIPEKDSPIYKRLYTKSFDGAAAVIARARTQANLWSQAIDQWHESFSVPGYFQRLWFSSLSSAICSTMISADPYFFEIESPHAYVNTMDVMTYSQWIYMINWPEIERMDMNQFFSCIPTEGQRKGFVWHSLWHDGAAYVEEPTFLVRLWRDYLWFNDREWLAKGFPHAVDAANQAYGTSGYQYLISSSRGRQSYDGWPMPGVSSYVNSAWIYGLYGLGRMSEVLQQPVTLDGIPVAEFRAKASAKYDAMLWNPELTYWNCFARVPGALPRSIANSAFTDQLFGKWVTLIDAKADGILPKDKVKLALETLYHHNLLEDSKQGFRGWVNGRQVDGAVDNSGIHAMTCWIGAQTDLGSLLGDSGDEAASLDVFRSVESSLHNNHLAVGEWNQTIDTEGRIGIAGGEPGKDTPRFVPYPRYKCVWEYLVRILGMKMDADNIYLKPFHSISFEIKNVKLAGMTLTVKVNKDWTYAVVDGKRVDGSVKLDRTQSTQQIEFVR